MAELILYYITDRKQLAGEEQVRQERLLECVKAAVHAGVDYIQLREKDLAEAELEILIGAVMARVRQPEKSVRLLINSPYRAAVAGAADGVHLPAKIPVAPVRAHFPRGRFLIGASCHTRAEVVRAQDAGADFAVFGPVFEKSAGLTDGRPGLGVERLIEACTAAPGWPVLALGGVTVENAAECMRAGAAGIAGIRLFQQGDVDRTVAELRAVAK